VSLYVRKWGNDGSSVRFERSSDRLGAIAVPG